MKRHWILHSWILFLYLTGSAWSQQPAPLNLEEDSSHNSNSAHVMIRHRDTFLMGENITVRKNEKTRSLTLLGGSAIIEGIVEGELVVLGGSATIKGRVERDVVVVSGSVIQEGEINGSLVAVLSACKIGSNAIVNRDLTIIAGPLEQEAGAIIRDDRIVIPLFINMTTFSWVRDWIMQGVLFARPFPPGVPWIWFFTGFMLALYLFLSLVFSKPLGTCVGTLEARPLASLVTGIITLMLIGPVFILLAVSIVGLIAIPFVACGLVVVYLFGKICVYRQLGHQIGKQLGVRMLDQPIIALVLGMAILCLLFMVPVIGFVVWSLALPMGLGAVTLALFASMRRDKDDTNRRDRDDTNNPSGFYTPPPSTQINEPSASYSAETSTSLPRVGFWLRLWASVLDIALVAFLLAVMGHPHFIPAGWILYHICMWTWRATTMGGIVLGLKIVRLNGQEVTFPVALVRGLACCLSAIPLFLGFFWAGWDADRQSWHDKIAGTVIVREPKGSSLIMF